MTCERKVPLKIFEEKTTYNCAYVDHKQPVRKIYHGPFDHPPVINRRRRRPYVNLNCNTLRPWNTVLPFNSSMTPKSITRTHPRQKYDYGFKVEDTGHDEAVRTRHRVFMLPAISMDDIADPEMRKLIVDNMYTSEWKKINAELTHNCTKRDILDTTYEDPFTKTCRFKYDMYQRWPAGWEEKCKEWEEKYPKNVVGLTEMYWEQYKNNLENTPAGKDPMRKFVSEDTRKEIRDLIKKDELRFCYDKLPQFYRGFKPRYAVGPLRKQDITEHRYESLKEGLKYCKYN